MKDKKTCSLHLKLQEVSNVSGLPKELVKENAEFLLKKVIKIKDDGSIWQAKADPMADWEVANILEEKFKYFRKSENTKNSRRGRKKFLKSC